MASNKNKKLKTAIGAVLLLAASAGNSIANPLQMSIGGITSQPVGHYEYCRLYANDCSIRSNDTKPTKLTRDRWKQIVEINAQTNYQIRPVTDLDYYGVSEKWAYPKVAGDCEDFVLMKRYLLMKAGWPASSLLVTVVRQTNGEGHAVLTVRTDIGDFILDNLEDKIMPWHESSYTFLKRQSAEHSGQWKDITDNRLMVGAVN